MGEGRQRYADYCIKIFEHSTEEAKREKTDLIARNSGHLSLPSTADIFRKQDGGNDL